MKRSNLIKAEISHLMQLAERSGNSLGIEPAKKDVIPMQECKEPAPHPLENVVCAYYKPPCRLSARPNVVAVVGETNEVWLAKLVHPEEDLAVEEPLEVMWFEAGVPKLDDASKRVFNLASTSQGQPWKDFLLSSSVVCKLRTGQDAFQVVLDKGLVDAIHAQAYVKAIV